MFLNLILYSKNSKPWYLSNKSLKISLLWVAVYFIIMCSGGRRKSNCVTEVEKIKAKREQRRAQQQAIREHVEETCDTSNPNWEFLQMIRFVNSTLIWNIYLHCENIFVQFISNQVSVLLVVVYFGLNRSWQRM